MTLTNYLRQLRQSSVGAVRRPQRCHSTVASPPPFDKILIANRGEIACRVMKTAKKMGIKTVAVYSDADAHALHVRMADEAFRVGPPPTSQSYLNIPSILEAIKQTGAQAVHPGYGFLSENFQFVKALDDHGVVFIGPSEKSMYAMGDKIQSKIIAKEAKVNTIPGYKGEVQDVDHAIQIAKDIGYPLMLKASAGGGGKGMRIAYNDKELREIYKLCKAEAKSFFGDDRLLVEKFIENPRHIEIQLIGDKYGNVFYLPERECSIQRRNQKVIEEAPSPHLNEATRRAMGEQAVALAKRVGYYSAGTCEFLVDPQRNFYFLEMNTRLQVEHPITELISGIDLVEMMIRVAANQKLPFTQKDLKISGWAFESRVYAEDPTRYLPSIGHLTRYVEPSALTAPQLAGKTVRCDSGIVEGSEISIYYDPMICKLCTHAPTRQEAMDIMAQALDAYVIKGVTHNIPLLRDVITSPRFQKGDLSTKYLAEEYPNGFQGRTMTDSDLQQLFSVAAYVFCQRDLRNRTWLQGGGSLPVKPKQEWELWIGLKDKPFVHVTAKKGENGALELTIDGKESLTVKADWKLESPLVNATIEGEETHQLTVQYLDALTTGLRLQFYGTKFDVQVMTAKQYQSLKYMKAKSKADLTKMILSPMPGTVISVNVKEGEEVAEGSEVAVVEAMKMQNVLHAPRAGKVKKVHVAAGQGVQGEDVIVELF